MASTPVTTLQADVEQAADLISGVAATSEGEKLLKAKFKFSPSDTSPGEAPTACSSTALGPAAMPEEAKAESMSRTAPAGTGLRFTYQSYSRATNNFEKGLGGGGCGSVFQGVLAAGTRVAVKRLELGVAAGAGAAGLSMTDQVRAEVEEEADRAMKDLLEEEVKTSAAANAVSELFEEEKDAAAASQKGKTCKERRRRVEDGEDDMKHAEEQCYKQEDTTTTKATSESEKKKIENVAAVPVVAGMKDRV
jgi:hypothetical protein